MINKPNISAKKIPSENSRDNFIAGFIGVNKTGKSSVARDLCYVIKDSKPKDHLFIGHDPQRMFRDLIKPEHLIDTEDKDWALKIGSYRNCTVILDEIKLICPNAQHPPKGLITLFSQFWFWNMDILWMAHNPKTIPDQCTYFTKLYYIFLSFVRKNQWKEKIPNYEFCLAASNNVNKYVTMHGRGNHRKSEKYDGQGFPFGIVDIERQKVKFINMNKPI